MIPHIRTILVPVDFEPPSLAALERAVVLGAQVGARVVPLHAHVSPDPNPGVVERLVERHRERERDAVAGATAEAQARWGLAVEHREGAPATTILQAIDDLDADLVVMGTHGRRGFDRLFFGSVAETVVHRSEVPVLLVRHAPVTPPRPVVVCATDLRAESRPAIDRARQLADAAGAQLELLHAYPIPFGAYPAFDPELVTRAVDEITRWATVELAGEARRVRAERRCLMVGDPAAAILDVARQIEPLLVVIGMHRRHGVSRLYTGSVSEWVLRRCPCPVLIVPCEEEAATTGAQAATAPAPPASP